MNGDANQTAHNLERHYWCFISYRHLDNREERRQWASWLHQELETYDVPEDLVGKRNDRGERIPERIYPVFRDEEELGVGNLTEKIFQALDRSKVLVVLCSPRAMGSTYLSKEIRHFKQHGRGKFVYAALLEGEPESTFPEPLRFEVNEKGEIQKQSDAEPLAADFRLPGGSQGWTSPETYRQELAGSGAHSKTEIARRIADYAAKLELGKLKIIAGILGVPLGTLLKRDKIYQLKLAERRTRILRRWLSAVTISALVAGFGAWIAYRQSVEASLQRDIARHNEGLSHLTRARVMEEAKRYPEALFYAAKAIGFDGVGLEPGKTERPTPAPFFGDEPRLGNSASKKTDLLDFPRLLIPGRGAHFDDAKEFLDQQPHYLPIWNNHASSSPATSVAMGADGRFLASTFADGVVSVWDLKDGIRHTLQKRGSGPEIRQIRFSPDGRWIAGAGGDSTVRLWMVPGWKSRDPLQGHEAPINAIAFSNDGTLCVSGAEDGTIMLWDPESGQAKATLTSGEPVEEAVTALSVSPIREYLDEVPPFLRAWSPLDPDYEAVRVESIVASGLRNGTVLLWIVDDHGEAEYHRLGQRTTAVTSLAFSPGGLFLLSGSSDNRLLLWNAGRFALESIRSVHSAAVHDIAFRPDGRKFATASQDGTVQLWTLDAFQDPLRKATAILSGHAPNCGVTGVTFSPDGHTLASASEDGSVKLWNVSDRKTAGDFLAYFDRGWYAFGTEELKAARMPEAGAAFLNTPQETLLAHWRNDAPDEDRLALILESGNWTRGLALVQAMKRSGDRARTHRILNQAATALKAERSNGRREYGDSWAESELETLVLAEGLTLSGEAMKPSVENPAPFTNEAGIEFVWIHPGTFVMGGSGVDEFSGDFNAIRRNVSLTSGFWMARYEVTQAQWKFYMGENPAGFPASGAYAPVEQVEWEDAMRFCANLAGRERERIPPGWEFTLPTEAQWEYACRAGTETEFHFGNVINGNKANFDSASPHGTLDDGPNLERTTRVGSYEPNNWGLYDMHGNVSEWCFDGYDDYDPEEITDPFSDPHTAESRVRRGGGWDDFGYFCRSFDRGGTGVSSGYHSLGFRPVLTRERRLNPEAKPAHTQSGSGHEKPTPEGSQLSPKPSTINLRAEGQNTAGPKLSSLGPKAEPTGSKPDESTLPLADWLTFHDSRSVHEENAGFDITSVAVKRPVDRRTEFVLSFGAAPPVTGNIVIWVDSDRSAETGVRFWGDIGADFNIGIDLDPNNPRIEAQGTEKGSPGAIAGLDCRFDRRETQLQVSIEGWKWNEFDFLVQENARWEATAMIPISRIRPGDAITLDGAIGDWKEQHVVWESEAPENAAGFSMADLRRIQACLNDDTLFCALSYPKGANLYGDDDVSTGEPTVRFWLPETDGGGKRYSFVVEAPFQHSQSRPQFTRFPKNAAHKVQDSTVEVKIQGLSLPGMRGMEVSTLIQKTDFVPDSAKGRLGGHLEGQWTIKGTTIFSGNRYKLFPNPSHSWEQAKLYCESLGGHLAIANSPREHEFLCQMKSMHLGESSRVWLGGHMPKVGGDWLWIDGTQIEENHWIPRKNFIHPSERFIVLNENDRWISSKADSDLVRGFICEWETEKRNEK